MLLNCSTDDVAILVSAGKLRALGKPRPNAVKFFSSIAGGSQHSLFLKSDGSLWGMGYDGLGQLGDGTYGGPPSGGV